MEYFNIRDVNQKEIFINLERVLWIEFLKTDRVITFYRGENDAVSVFIAEEEYEVIKRKLIKVLSSSTRVVLD